MAKGTGVKAVGGLLLLALLLAGVGWWFRDSLPWGRTEEPTEISPEIAALAEAKLQRLRDDDETVRLNSAEMSSLLRYRSPEWTRQNIGDPLVEMSGDTLRFSGTFPTDRLPSHPELDRVRGLLPERARIEVAGGLRSLAPGRAAVDIRDVEFAGIPIPSRYYPQILERLGRREESGLSDSSLAIDLPAGVSSARVEDGYLVLSP